MLAAYKKEADLLSIFAPDLGDFLKKTGISSKLLTGFIKNEKDYKTEKKKYMNRQLLCLYGLDIEYKMHNNLWCYYSTIMKENINMLYIYCLLCIFLYRFSSIKRQIILANLPGLFHNILFHNDFRGKILNKHIYLCNLVNAPKDRIYNIFYFIVKHFGHANQTRLNIFLKFLVLPQENVI